jgi:hypothetical protein
MAGCSTNDRRQPAFPPSFFPDATSLSFGFFSKKKSKINSICFHGQQDEEKGR